MTHGAILRGSAILPLGYTSRGDYHFVHNKNSFCVTVIIVIQQKKASQQINLHASLDATHHFPIFSDFLISS